MNPAASLPPREYIHHSARTVSYLKSNYSNYTMRQMSTHLGIDSAKIKALARREGLKKRKSLL